MEVLFTDVYTSQTAFQTRKKKQKKNKNCKFWFYGDYVCHMVKSYTTSNKRSGSILNSWPCLTMFKTSWCLKRQCCDVLFSISAYSISDNVDNNDTLKFTAYMHFSLQTQHKSISWETRQLFWFERKQRKRYQT